MSLPFATRDQIIPIVIYIYSGLMGQSIFKVQEYFFVFNICYSWSDQWNATTGNHKGRVRKPHYPRSMQECKNRSWRKKKGGSLLAREGGGGQVKVNRWFTKKYFFFAPFPKMSIWLISCSLALQRHLSVFVVIVLSLSNCIWCSSCKLVQKQPQMEQNGHDKICSRCQNSLGKCQNTSNLCHSHYWNAIFRGSTDTTFFLDILLFYIYILLLLLKNILLFLLGTDFCVHILSCYGSVIWVNSHSQSWIWLIQLWLSCWLFKRQGWSGPLGHLRSSHLNFHLSVCWRKGWI